MIEAESRYCGPEGAAYWDRNAERVANAQTKRQQALRSLVPIEAAWHWLEVGCGRGNNLLPGDVGLDCDARQLDFLPRHVTPIIGHAYDLTCFPSACFPVVFSVGCLMHLPGGHCQQAVKEMARVSSRYVIIGEYWSDQEEAIRNKHWDGCLWKRPYAVPGMRLIQSTTLSPFDDDVIFGVFQK